VGSNVRIPLPAPFCTYIGWGCRNHPRHSIAEGYMKVFSNASEARRVRARRTGQGRYGLLGRFRVLLPRLRYWSRSHGQAEPITTPEKMLEIWNSQSGQCAACGGKMELQGVNGSCFDHDHETGKSRGFIHRDCNSIEGLFSKMSDEEVLSYLTWMKEVVQQRDKCTQVAPVVADSLAG
jgi:hypothetical protein